MNPEFIHLENENIGRISYLLWGELRHSKKNIKVLMPSHSESVLISKRVIINAITEDETILK